MISASASIRAKSSYLLPSFKLTFLRCDFLRFLCDLLEKSHCYISNSVRKHEVFDVANLIFTRMIFLNSNSSNIAELLVPSTPGGS